MGLFKDLTKKLKDQTKDLTFKGITKQIGQQAIISAGNVLRQAELNSRFGNIFTGEIAGNDIFSINYNVQSSELFTGLDAKANLGNVVSYSKLKGRHGSKFSGVAGVIDSSGQYSTSDDTDIYKFTMPNWGYGDFVNERNIYLKHLSNGYDEPNWFYFKIFFDFSSEHGLLGGILNSDGGVFGVNTAYSYLNMLKGYTSEKLTDRKIALEKFVRLLSYINIHAPWFFKSVKNLSTASNPLIDNFSEEKALEIELNQDAIDMRISTLLSLYKYVCYDDFNCKEILPDNLRKFDLCVAIFSSPIKQIHNPRGNNKTYKKLYNNGNDTESIMSYKLYKFMNCEIDRTTIGTFIPGQISNEQPFKIGENSIKIKYDRVYEYMSNEYMGFMIGSDGLYFNNETINIEELEYNDMPNMISASEEFIHQNIDRLLGKNVNYALGNIYGQTWKLYDEVANQSFDRSDGTTVSAHFSDWTKAKMQSMVVGQTFALDLGYDYLYKLLGMSYKSGTAEGTNGMGTVLKGQGNHGLGSKAYEEKLKRGGNNSTMSSRENLLLNKNTFQNFDLKNAIKNIILKR